jgi:hypothetical protein
MGYNVQIKNSNAKIFASNLARAYEKMCALNVTHHSAKRGGSWSGGKQTEKWFSWMDANYPETCSDAQAILEQMGFETSYDTNGDLLIDGYDNKSGQEDLFLEAIKYDATGKIEWFGEDGSTWTTEFCGDTVLEQSASKLLTN